MRQLHVVVKAPSRYWPRHLDVRYLDSCDTYADARASRTFRFKVTEPRDIASCVSKEHCRACLPHTTRPKGRRRVLVRRNAPSRLLHHAGWSPALAVVPRVRRTKSLRDDAGARFAWASPAWWWRGGRGRELAELEHETRALRHRQFMKDVAAAAPQPPSPSGRDAPRSSSSAPTRSTDLDRDDVARKGLLS